MPRPKTAPQTLCEPGQSKRMSRFSYSVSWFMRETIAPKTMQAEIAYGVYRWLWHQAKRRRDKRRPEVERRETLCARLRASQNELRRRTAQNEDIHVVRACAVKTQSRFHKSHFILKITGKCRGLKLHRRLCASLGSRNACQDLTRATLYRNFQVKNRGPE